MPEDVGGPKAGLSDGHCWLGLPLPLVLPWL